MVVYIGKIPIVRLRRAGSWLSLQLRLLVCFGQGPYGIFGIDRHIFAGIWIGLEYLIRGSSLPEIQEQHFDTLREAFVKPAEALENYLWYGEFLDELGDLMLHSTNRR